MAIRAIVLMPHPRMTVPSEILSCLRPHQRTPAQSLLDILQKGRAGVDMSVMGSGKTYIASAVMSALTLPILIVAPKVSLTQWKRAAEHFGDTFSIINYEQLRYGNIAYGTWQNGRPPERTERETFTCQSCQAVLDPKNLTTCYAHHLGIHCIQTRIRPHRYGKFNFHPAIGGIVFDEVHRCAHDSLNADMLIGAKRQNKIVLGLSATIGNSPLH